MCLIIAVESARDMSLARFEEAILSAVPFNPDGIGITYCQDGKAQIMKRVKSYNDVISKALDLYQFTEQPFVVHLRYSTMGTNSQANTHPFRISSTVAMAHNKTLDIQPAAHTWSDSRTVAELLRRLCKADRDFYGSALFWSFIEHQAGFDNRFVFLDAEQEIVTIVNEHLGCYHDGLWFSNLYSWSPSTVGIKRSSRQNARRSKLEQLPGAQDEELFDYSDSRYGDDLPLAWEQSGRSHDAAEQWEHRK